MDGQAAVEKKTFKQKFLSRDVQRVLVIVSFMAVPLILLMLFTYVPFAKMIQFSFYNMKYIGPRKFVGWANYRQVFKNKELFGSLVVSLYYMGGGVIQLALSLLFATMFVFKVKGEAVFKACLFFPYLICGIAIGFIFKFFYFQGYVLDTILMAFGMKLEDLPLWLQDTKINNVALTWFFANAYKMLGDARLLDEARHGYEFMRRHCFDKDAGGVFWSVKYDGTPEDTTKHTYNQAFTIYALSSYYDASGDKEALARAMALFHLIENKMRDEGGYLEAFNRDFTPASNEKLSENGVMATRTMNTLLHVLEAYTELLRVSGNEEVREKLHEILTLFTEKVWNPEKKRQEVFFDHEYNTLIDLYSYGHDIESAWLLDRTAEVLGEKEWKDKLDPITDVMRDEVLKEAFDGRSIPAECERGKVKEDRVWWVQAEGVNGYLSGWKKHPERTDWHKTAEKLWGFIRDYVVDHRPGSEWFWYVSKDGVPAHEPIVEPWKCPYHNGRMCMEALKWIDTEQ